MKTILALVIVFGIGWLILTFVEKTESATKSLVGGTEKQLRASSNSRAEAFAAAPVWFFASSVFDSSTILEVALEVAQQSGAAVSSDATGYKLAFRTRKGDASVFLSTPVGTGDILQLRLLGTNTIGKRLNRGLLSAATYAESLEGRLRATDPAIQIRKEES